MDKETREMLELILQEVRENRKGIEANSERITETRAYIEMRIEKQIQLLGEGHQLIIEKMADKERLDDLEQRVKTLEHILEAMRSA